MPAQTLAPILLAAMLARLFFLAATPYDHRSERLGIRGFNDEPSHINFVRHLAEHGDLPVQTRSVRDADALVHNDFEYYQAPLYYLLAAPAYSALEEAFPGAGPLSPRLLSACFGVLTVAVAFAIGSRFGNRAAVLCGWLAALFPTSVYFTSIAVNDSLAWLLGAFLLSRILASSPREGGFRDVLPIGLLLGLGLLAKSSLLTWLPLLFVKPLISAWQDRRPARLLPAFAAAGLALLTALPYYARNFDLYGSPLGLAAGHGPENGLFFQAAWHRVHEFLAWTLITFWNPLNPRLVFDLAVLQILILVLTGLTAGILLLGGWREIRSGRAWDGNRAVLVAAVLLAASGYLHYNLNWLQADARLMFHAFPALAALFALCLEPQEPADPEAAGMDARKVRVTETYRYPRGCSTFRAMGQSSHRIIHRKRDRLRLHIRIHRLPSTHLAVEPLYLSPIFPTTPPSRLPGEYGIYPPDREKCRTGTNPIRIALS